MRYQRLLWGRLYAILRQDELFIELNHAPGDWVM